MTHKLRWLALSGLMAVLAASAAACGPDDETPPEQKTRCTDVDCGSDPGVSCDPADGECKCGGEGGVICPSGDSCVLALNEAPSCSSSQCVSSACTGGTSCDQFDGLCKCSGAICNEGEICSAGKCESSGLCDDVVCSAGETCDGADGQCKCGGLGGAVCSFGEACVDGACQANECAGVNCGPGTVCNPADGQCHCGAVDGPACTSGQACSDDDGVAVCVGVDVCADSDCPAGTVCDPTSEDGVCRCGGIGPTYPVCTEGQTCDMVRGSCIGGDQCANVVCENGNSCNDENGMCSCGGRGFLPCDDGLLCVQLNSAAACTQPCSPIGPNTCGDGKMCVFDDTQAYPAAFCVDVPASPVEIDRECTGPFQCDAGAHCAEVSEEDVCRPYCQDADGTTAVCPPDEFCRTLAGAADRLGFCRPN